MPRILMLILTGLTWTSVSSAAVLARPFFFEVTSPAGQKSHLFGTIHAGISLKDFGPEISQTLSQARVVLFERVLSADDSETFFRDPTPLFRNTGTAAKIMGAQLEELLALGLAPELASKLTDRDCYRAGRYRMKWFYPFLDVEIMQLTHRQKIVAEELESTEVLSQADAQFAEQPVCSLSEIANREGGLKKWITHFDEDMAAMVEIYRKGDTTTDMTSDEPSMRFRNRHWIPKIEEQFLKGRAVVVVGVAHLYGYSGLIELLRDRGFKVRRADPAQ